MRHMQNTHEGVERIASRTWASALACFGSFPFALGFLLFIVVFRPQQSCLLQPTYPSTLEVARPESGDCVGAELGFSVWETQDARALRHKQAAAEGGRPPKLR